MHHEWPYLIFKSNISLPLIRLGYQKKGYTDGEIGVEWIKHFDKHTRGKAAGHRRLLLVDGHVSHYMCAFLEYACNNKIHVLCYPCIKVWTLPCLELWSTAGARSGMIMSDVQGGRLRRLIFWKCTLQLMNSHSPRVTSRPPSEKQEWSHSILALWHLRWWLPAWNYRQKEHYPCWCQVPFVQYQTCSQRSGHWMIQTSSQTMETQAQVSTAETVTKLAHHSEIYYQNHLLILILRMRRLHPTHNW